MIVKKNWTEQDFEEMGWHDSLIYNLSFPQNNQDLVLDIDYVFEWILNEDTNFFSFQVSPCILTFKSVLYLKVTLDFEDSIGINIEEIVRKDPTLSPNKTALYWTYIINTDKGEISFKSPGFLQTVQKQPIFSESLSLGR